MTYSLVDLHTHTYFSDGRASPEELLGEAASRGIQVLAISDHDTGQGVRVALPFARQRGITLVPAVEFTTRWDACDMPPGESDIDLLGYYIDLESLAFKKAEAASIADFTSRMQTWCSAFSERGYPVTLNDVLSQNPRYPGTLQLVQALVSKGFSEDMAGADMLVRSHMKYMPACAMTIEQAITNIHAAGGIAVLAHPSTHYLRWHGDLLNEEGLCILVKMGLDGIEIFHQSLINSTRAHFMELVKKFNLIVTGGSDEHGWPSGLPELGNQQVTMEMVRALEKRAGK
jgi:predicted metal-dependent phosphoesterase TrpH